MPPPFCNKKYKFQQYVIVTSTKIQYTRKKFLHCKKNGFIIIPSKIHPILILLEGKSMSSNVRPESMERITTFELAQKFIDEQVAEVRAQVGDKKVLLALSGGVDSSVVAALLIKAIGSAAKATMTKNTTPTTVPMGPIA